MTPELLGNEEKYNLHSQEVHLVMMISWGVVIRDGLIIRKFEYAKMISFSTLPMHPKDNCFPAF